MIVFLLLSIIDAGVHPLRRAQTLTRFKLHLPFRARVGAVHEVMDTQWEFLYRYRTVITKPGFELLSWPTKTGHVLSECLYNGHSLCTPLGGSTRPNQPLAPPDHLPPNRRCLGAVLLFIELPSILLPVTLEVLHTCVDITLATLQRCDAQPRPTPSPACCTGAAPSRSLSSTCASPSRSRCCCSASSRRARSRSPPDLR